MSSSERRDAPLPRAGADVVLAAERERGRGRGRGADDAASLIIGRWVPALAAALSDDRDGWHLVGRRDGEVTLEVEPADGEGACEDGQPGPSSLSRARRNGGGAGTATPEEYWTAGRATLPRRTTRPVFEDEVGECSYRPRKDFDWVPTSWCTTQTIPYNGTGCQVPTDF